MGVPAFYRWISEKYPKIVQHVLEQRPKVFGDTLLPVNLEGSNPNGTEFDCLYVDMNGLIHPCSHPEDREAPATEEEMYANVTKYVDRLVAAIRPRKLLFLAIDGVAPRAKMNQQRSRRFRSAQEAREKKEMMEEVFTEMEDLGLDIPDRKSTVEWDSNVITPGTDFMYRISMFLRFYILDKMNHDNYWKGLTVILSDANEPGEGEHKIMEYIRLQRCQPGYDPNTHHVLHGLDADLIMLALATHEARFTILREKVHFGRKNDGEEVNEAQRMLDAQAMRNGALVCALSPDDEWMYRKPLQALHVHTLRQYLANEFQSLQYTLPFRYDFERVIDDFIFMCFFVGNDFLPHLPSLDIRDGALDFLIECYKDVLPSLGDYLTSPGGYINLYQADVLLSRVAEVEDKIFARKKAAEDNFERRQQNRPPRNNNNNGGNNNTNNSNNSSNKTNPPSAVVPNDNNAAAASLRASLLGKRTATDNSDTSPPPSSSEKSKRQKLDESNASEWDSEEEEALEEEIVAPLLQNLSPQKKAMSEEELNRAKEDVKARIKTKENELFDKYKANVSDGVKLHEIGWKERYYGEKFKKEDVERGGGLRNMCVAYVQGLCWVLQYYYQGVPSWNWYYPFHYAPFASDLFNIDSYGDVMVFHRSQPFRPIEQLLAVLPSSSAPALPEECRWLMLDAESPIIDIYDENVPIDPNGKHLPWLWILLLPFVDETRITAAFSACKQHLTLHSLRKNAFDRSVVFVHETSRLVELAKDSDCLGLLPEVDADILEHFRRINKSDGETTDALVSANVSAADQAVDFDCDVGKGCVSGAVGRVGQKWHAPLQADVSCPPNCAKWFSRATVRNHVAVFQYGLPPLHHLHKSEILPGAVEPPSVLDKWDLQWKRPPRLNKSGFNVLDLFQSTASTAPHQQERASAQWTANYSYERNNYQAQSFNSGRYTERFQPNPQHRQQQQQHCHQQQVMQQQWTEPIRRAPHYQQQQVTSYHTSYVHAHSTSHRPVVPQLTVPVEHRVEPLWKPKSQQPSQSNVGNAQRKGKIVMMDNLPGSRSEPPANQDTGRQRATQPVPQSSQHSFQPTATFAQPPRPLPNNSSGAPSMQTMREQLLQTLNRRGQGSSQHR